MAKKELPPGIVSSLDALEIRAEERMLADVQYNLDHLEKELDKLEGNSPGDSLNCRSTERVDYGERIRKVKRDITSQTRFRDQHNKRIAELEQKRQELEAEKLRVREQQIFE